VQASDQTPLKDAQIWPVAIGRPVLVNQQARPPLRHPVWQL
jgi:hypothetical protein